MSDQDLSAVEKIALACVVPSTEVTALKRSMPDGSDRKVDFTAHISGWIHKGKGKPRMTATKPAVVDPLTLVVVADLLRRLKVSPAQLRRSLAAAVRLHDQDITDHPELDDLAAVISDAAETHAATLDPIPVTTNAKAGPVDGSDLAVRLIPHQGQAPCPTRSTRRAA